MKTIFSIILLHLLLGSVQASDTSCQVNVLKPKMSSALTIAEQSKPAELTIAEARIRLNQDADEKPQETAKVDEEKVETAKKESGLGSMFDILLPSKLRNPAQ